MLKIQFACVNEDCVACQEGLLVECELEENTNVTDSIQCQGCGKYLCMVSIDPTEDWMPEEE